MPQLNSKGRIAFRAASTIRVGALFDYAIGLWSERSDGQLARRVHIGDVAPGIDNAYFEELELAGFNSSGHLAFRGIAKQPFQPHTDIPGIWMEDENGTVELVATEGTPAGGVENATFSYVGTPLLNNLGDALFFGGLAIGDGITSANSAGLWKGTSKQDSELIVCQGSEAPGSDGAFFTNSFTRYKLNNSGQAAFAATLSGGDIGGFGERGIWASDRHGELKLIAIEGQLVDVSSDPLVEDLRTIRDLGFDEHYRDIFKLNDRGQIAFRAIFSDGSQAVLVSNVVAIPEPSSWTILGFGSLAVFIRLRILARS